PITAGFTASTTSAKPAGSFEVACTTARPCAAAESIPAWNFGWVSGSTAAIGHVARRVPRTQADDSPGLVQILAELMNMSSSSLRVVVSVRASKPQSKYPLFVLKEKTLARQAQFR